MTDMLQSLWIDESGQDLAEYGLLLALIAVALVGAVIAFRNQIISAFNKAENNLKTP